ncbi:4Fe-4S ferredoxin iron-sulfur binding domain protein [Elusimicrobium minutum Pei191]|uniref:4Fe-4S ferredoxin iron-sulfur binding domain protein n=1 Tax=Elusimicrobium minutum (strain Pei191) TaxID=445932 RepID=B2KBW6_ELUMP|nr:4Fe-4S binding protein [Elusimicrobium minutum]ACC97870.1 4Fe-4S ferredoxin iron-sulfur binding domain protein [Elusimicrobium minutum Pei191]
MENLHLIYYSPALSTKNIICAAAKQIPLPIIEHDITQGIKEPIALSKADFAVFASPVFAGRIPAMAADIFKTIKGKNTPAVIMVVYGNRDYDDALLELKDISSKNGFLPVSAGAFIARHSIFTKVAEQRPDNSDINKITEFIKKSFTLAQNGNITKELKVKGNTPYKTPGKIPLKPSGTYKCNKCGVCVAACPVKAIPADNPKKTDKEKCFSCARCIALCPQHARKFKGILFKIAAIGFAKKVKLRKEPETFFIN